MTYSDLTKEQLEEKIKLAREWLTANENHPRYNEALKRYVALKGEFTKRQSGWMMDTIINA